MTRTKSGLPGIFNSSPLSLADGEGSALAVNERGELIPQGSTQSTLNSTTAALGSGLTYTGTWEQNTQADAFVMVKTDNTGTLYFDFSPDGVNVDSTFPTNGFKVASGVPAVHRAVKAGRYFRVRFVNDTGAQTYMRLTTYFGSFSQLNAPVNQTLGNNSDASVVHSLDSETDYMIGAYGTDRFTITKFGRNADVDTATTPEDIWNGGGAYTGFPTGSAETVDVSSSSVNDRSAGTGARTIRIIGLDANYNIQQEDITLNGTTKVTSVNTWRRVNRAYLLTAGSGAVNAGTITVQHTTTTANIFVAMPIGYGQSQITCYTIPANYTGYLKSYRASLFDNTSNTAEVAFWTRELNAAVRIQRPFTVSTAFNSDVRLYSGIAFPEKTDIAMRVMSISANNADIQGSFDILLVKN